MHSQHSGLTRPYLIQLKLLWAFKESCGVASRGMVWCGVVWRGVVWCGMVWCGVVWGGVEWAGAVAWIVKPELQAAPGCPLPSPCRC